MAKRLVSWIKAVAKAGLSAIAILVVLGFVGGVVIVAAMWFSGRLGNDANGETQPSIDATPIAAMPSLTSLGSSLPGFSHRLIPDGRAIAIRSLQSREALVAAASEDQVITAVTSLNGFDVISSTTVSLNEAGLGLDKLRLSAHSPDNDGIILGGTVDVFDDLSIHPTIALVRVASDGRLDHTFGTDGVLLTPVDSWAAIAERDAALRSIAVDSTGRIVLAGRVCIGGDDARTCDLLLLGLTDTGEIDTGFGNGGAAVIDLGGRDEAVSDLLVLENDELVIAGYRCVATSVDGGGCHAMVGRILADGSPDPSFADGGFAITADQEDADERFSAVAADAAGTLLAGGDTAGDLLVARYTRTGQLDERWGDSGRAIHKVVGTGGSAPNSAAGLGNPIVGVEAMHVRADGRVVVLGELNFEMFAGLLEADGSLAIAYGDRGWAALPGVEGQPTNGVQLSPLSPPSPDAEISRAGVAASLLDVDDEIVVLTSTARLARISMDGEFDRSVEGPEANAVGIEIPGALGLAGFMAAVHGDGSIALVGEFDRESGGQIAAAWLTQDGQLARRFGSGGVRISLGEPQSLEAVAVDVNQRIVVGVRLWEASRAGVALVRLQPDGSLDRSFGRGGLAYAEMTDRVVLKALAEDHAGRLIAVTTPIGNSGLVVARFDARGRLDPSFGDAGVVTVEDATASKRVRLRIVDEQIEIAAVDASGVTVVALDHNGGEASRLDLPTASQWWPAMDILATPIFSGDSSLLLVGTRGSLLQVVALDSAGQPHSGFGVEGMATIDLGLPIYADAADVLPDGRVVVAGSVTELDGRFVVAMFLASGSIDASFGQGGTTVISGEGLGFTAVDDLHVLQDGSFLVLDAIDGVMRFTPGGQLAQDFGT